MGESWGVDLVSVGLQLGRPDGLVPRPRTHHLDDAQVLSESANVRCSHGEISWVGG